MTNTYEGISYKQYFGAKYVPTLYQGSDGTNNWESGVSYEALTIVTDMNASYTSKKVVPATIGRPSQNLEYWVLTGNYNAQIATIQENITGIQGDITGIQGDITNIEEKIENMPTQQIRKFILVSDSYGMDTNSKPTWTELFTQQFPNSINLSFSGAGFFVTGSPTFLARLTTQAQSMSQEEKDSITDIITAGGWNDSRQFEIGKTESQLKTAIQNYINFCKTNFKNAKIWIGFIGWQCGAATSDLAIFSDLVLAQNIYEEIMVENVYHLPNSSQPMKDSYNIDNSKLHPNKNGSLALYHTILGDIYGGYVYRRFGNITSSNFTLGSGNKITTIQNFITGIYGNEAFISGTLVGVTGSGTLLTFKDNVLPWAFNRTVQFIATSGNPDNKAIYCEITTDKEFKIYTPLTNGDLYFNVKIDALYSI